MANEPQIEFKGNAFEVKTFNDGGSVVKVVVRPSYQDKQSQQWVELEPMYFDVHPFGKESEAQAKSIAQLLAQNNSVRVLVNGSLTEKKGQQGGAFKHVNARTLIVISSKPKQQNSGGYGGNMSQNTSTKQQADQWSSAEDWSNDEPAF